MSEFSRKIIELTAQIDLSVLHYECDEFDDVIDCLKDAKEIIDGMINALEESGVG